MKKFKKKSLPILDRLRLIKRTTSQAINEIRNANSISDLVSKYSVNGVCKSCGKTAVLIKSTGYCVNCSLGNKSKLFNNKAVNGVCVICGHEGLVDIVSKKCLNCYMESL